MKGRALRLSLALVITVSVMLALGCVKGSDGHRTAAAEPIVIGDLTPFSGGEIEALKSLARANTSQPWLIHVQVYHAEFYFSDTETAMLRRGSFFAFVLAPQQPAGSRAWRSFSIDGRYAQVAVEGRGLDQLDGKQDLNWPFEVQGQFRDAELISLITFIRSRPSYPNGKMTVSGERPIFSVMRESGNRVTVTIQMKPSHFEDVSLEKDGNAWIVISAGMSVA